MMSDLNRPCGFRARMALAAATASALALSMLPFAAAPAQDRPVPDTFEATTTGMTPDGLTLKLDVLRWSDADARAAVLAALAQDSDVSAALAELPSAGVVWRSGSGVGHSIKYAYRETLDDGRERITVVTDKPLDSYSFKPWEMPTPAQAALEYTVIELVVGADGNGAGTMTPAATVEIDAEAATVSLDHAGAAMVLAGARELPKPYWARASQ